MKKKKSCPIAEMGFDRRIGSYLISIKIGNYQEFNSFLHTNQRHYHDCYELVLIIDGFGDFEHKSAVHTLKSGDLFIAKPFTEHEIHIVPSESMTVFYLFFKITSNQALTNNSYEEQLIKSFTRQHAPFIHNNVAMLTYLNFINDYSSLNHTKSDPWLARIVFDFLFNSLERLSITPPKQQPSFGTHDVNTFESILDYIDQNMERKITADSIADTVGLSRRTIYNMFREHLNSTVHAYIKERKMALAKHYLTMNLPVSEVAGLVGYESLPQFSRTFKVHAGMSPSEYIRQESTIPIGIGRRLSQE